MHHDKDLSERAPPPQRLRRPYEKPALRTIDLVAEEVLSVGCKMAIAPGGPVGATCTSASCFADGS